MCVKKLFALAVALCLLLCGCQRTGELENQAYVLILGLDRLPDGGLRLTARVPKIGNSAPDGGQGGQGGKYLTFAAEGADWADALEALERATPRPLNLSHIVLLVISRAAASQAGCFELLRQVAETPHLYTTARLVVCDASAGDFIGGLDTVIGTRLSAELKAMLSHYAEEGFIPRSSLADYYYAAGSVYSDPVAAYARLSAEPGGSAESSPMKQRYEGAALFREGRFIGALGPEDARLLSLIRGDTGALTLDLNGRAVELTLQGGAKRRVDIGEGGARLRVDMGFSTLEALSEDRLRSVTDRIRSSVTDLIARCQALGCDPFGFSERAAARYATLSAWLSSGWRRMYAEASVDVRIRLRGQE